MGGDGSASDDTETRSPASGSSHGLRADDYSYQDVLTLLREDDAVVPKRPPIHPFHTVYNREAVIPPMCYTRTEGRYNPCYVCHQGRIPGRPNEMDDVGLQLAYSFSDVGLTNHWHNLFEDRTDRIAKISDEEILDWVELSRFCRHLDRGHTLSPGGMSDADPPPPLHA